MNRRRAITTLGAASIGCLTACRKGETLRTFSSIAFGTEVSFQVYGISNASFAELASKCSSRLQEIESHFSLYQEDSTIRRLNREGFLKNPPAEFLLLLRIALDFGKSTQGLFDITVQVLWDWRQRWKDANFQERQALHGETWEKTLALVDFRKIDVSESFVSFTKPGMSITLNGIVQGYATDQISSLLKKSGVHNALVNIGEYAALGSAPDGKPWPVNLAATAETLALPTGRALAVSAGSGHTFDPEGRFHHIFRPSDGSNRRHDSSTVVTASSATTADALSTTLTVASLKERNAILAKFPEATFREISNGA